MQDARPTTATPALFQKAVDGLDDIPMEGRYTKGDVYEYTLGKIATSGQNGHFRQAVRSIVDRDDPHC